MTGKGLAAALGILLASASTAVAGASQFGESCVGTEIVQVDGQPAKNLPYSLVFSVDTKRKLYCYGECLEGQTYSVSDPLSSPMKLADIDVQGSGSSHHIRPGVIQDRGLPSHRHSRRSGS